MNSIAFQIKLDKNIIQLPDIEAFLGKEVIITIVEITQTEKPKQKNWQFLGSVNLKGNVDQQNIRDLAYE